MSHSGEWIDRTLMANRIMGFGAGMIVAGGIGGFFGGEASIMNNLILTGGGMITMVAGFMIGGKAYHDKGREK